MWLDSDEIAIKLERIPLIMGSSNWKKRLLMTSLSMQASMLEDLTRRMKGVFARHGAVPMTSKLLGNHSDLMSSNAVSLLDRNCSTFTLRHEMRLPFALWLSRKVHLHDFSSHPAYISWCDTRLWASKELRHPLRPAIMCSLAVTIP